jgi:hypothetical protein
MSISKDTKLRVTIALTSESAAEELLEAIQEGSNDDLADNFAKKDLSNLTTTSIPAGTALKSISTNQSRFNAVFFGVTGLRMILIIFLFLYKFIK